MRKCILQLEFLAFNFKNIYFLRNGRSDLVLIVGVPLDASSLQLVVVDFIGADREAAAHAEVGNF